MELKQIETLENVVDTPAADGITQMILATQTLEPCFWCGSQPSSFMIPSVWTGTADRLYCSLCGRYSRNRVDGRIIPPLVQAWCDTIHPLNAAASTIFESIDPELAGMARMSVQITISVSPYSGLPENIHVTINDSKQPKRDIWIYEWKLYGAIAPVINQSVRSRLNHDPLFDLSSYGACTNCGANPARHIMSNYSEISREGDIYCGGCGEYVRMWNAG